MRTIGVLGLQGDVIEHIEMLMKLKSRPIWVKRPQQFKDIDALIIPGGESTSISRQIAQNNLYDEIISLADSGRPILGTCAGAILLAKEGDRQVGRTKQQLLKLMDMKINRNAFGRQRESFEARVDLKDMAKKFPAVFIRAPLIEKVYGNCGVLATLNGKIVAAQQKNLLATCFHPELSADTRIHRYFLSMIQ